MIKKCALILVALTISGMYGAEAEQKRNAADHEVLQFAIFKDAPGDFPKDSNQLMANIPDQTFFYRYNDIPTLLMHRKKIHSDLQEPNKKDELTTTKLIADSTVCLKNAYLLLCLQTMKWQQSIITGLSKHLKDAKSKTAQCAFEIAQLKELIAKYEQPGAPTPVSAGPGLSPEAPLAAAALGAGATLSPDNSPIIKPQSPLSIVPTLPLVAAPAGSPLTQLTSAAGAGARRASGSPLALAIGEPFKRSNSRDLAPVDPSRNIQ